MAHRPVITTGNYTATSTWGTGTNTPSIHASTNITITGTPVSATFTAPSLTDASRGVIVYYTGAGTSTSFTATLQEDTGGGFVDTAATATITKANVSVNSFLFFRWNAYTFATTTANKYRVKMTSNNNTGTLAADSGGSNFAFLHVDNRSAAVPTTGDVLWVVGNNNASPLLTLTVDGTSNACGNSVNNSSITRDWTNSVNVSAGAVLKHDTAASSTLTVTGSTMIYPGGTFQMQPASASVVASYLQAAGSANLYEFRVGDGGSAAIAGTSKTYVKTTLSSGTGTAASPAIMADSVDWSVGDEVYIFATDNGATNYNNCERRFIITKNSATSYVWSSTSGGAEAALANTHSSSARVMNITRNAIIGSSTANNSNAFAVTTQSGSAVTTISWARFNKMSVASGGALLLSAGVTQCDYSVVDTFERTGVRYPQTTTAQTFTGNMALNGSSVAVSATGAQILNTAKNKTLVDCWSFNSNGYGFVLSNAYACTITGGGSNALKGNTGSDGIQAVTSGLCTITSHEINACRGRAIRFEGLTDSRFVSCGFGNKGVNQVAEFNVTTDTYNTVVFDSLTASSSTFFLSSTYLNAIVGSKFSFHKLQGTDYNHYVYTVNGVKQTTGASLTDTTNRTSGNYSYRLAPVTSDGATHQYLVLARANTNVVVSGFMQMNSTFTGDASTVLTASLYLPGTSTSGTPDATATISKATSGSWLPYTLNANYTGSIDDFATVIIKATNPNATASTYVYHTDVFNGTNSITGFKVWKDGEPSLIMFEQLGDMQANAAAVWGYLTSNSAFTTTGTAGKTLKDIDGNAELAAVR